jgi:hypothetical protein
MSLNERVASAGVIKGTVARLAPTRQEDDHIPGSGSSGLGGLIGLRIRP